MKKLTLLLLLLLSFYSQASTDKPSIIALSPHVVEMLFSLGAGEQIIGTSEFADFPDAAKSIPRVGNFAKLQIEQIIGLKPDIIIAWRSGTPSTDLTQLERLGFTVVYSEPKTFDDIASELRHFGKLTGHPVQGEQLANSFLSKLTSIKLRYQHKAKITVFYELWDVPLTTIAANSWPQQHLDICGASNPFLNSASQYPIVNIEQVLSEHISLIIQPLSSNQPDKKGYNWQQWPDLPAIKHQQVIAPDADQLHRMSVRAIEELALLCEKIDVSRQYYQTAASIPEINNRAQAH